VEKKTIEYKLNLVTFSPVTQEKITGVSRVLFFFINFCNTVNISCYNTFHSINHY